MIALPDKRMLWETKHEFNRRMAKKYGLDFEFRCAFWHQVKRVAPGISDDWKNQELEVPMESGQTALYLVTKHDDKYGGTGQRIWRFQFLRYLTRSN